MPRSKPPLLARYTCDEPLASLAQRRPGCRVHGRSSWAVVALLGCGPFAAASCASETRAPVTPVVVSVSAAPMESAEPHGAAMAAPEHGGYQIFPGVSVPEAWVDCRTEEDCAIVESGCCDHCNGAAITTVNRAFANQAKALLAHVGCDRPCANRPCDRAESHQLLCMTRACHFADLEPEVEERIWGGTRAGASDSVDAETLIEAGR